MFIWTFSASSSITKIVTYLTDSNPSNLLVYLLLFQFLPPSRLPPIKLNVDKCVFIQCVKSVAFNFQGAISN